MQMRDSLKEDVTMDEDYLTFFSCSSNKTF